MQFYKLSLSARAPRDERAEADRRRGRAENGGNDATGFDEKSWLKRDLVAGDLGDVSGFSGRAESH